MHNPCRHDPLAAYSLPPVQLRGAMRLSAVQRHTGPEIKRYVCGVLPGPVVELGRSPNDNVIRKALAQRRNGNDVSAPSPPPPPTISASSAVVDTHAPNSRSPS